MRKYQPFLLSALCSTGCIAERTIDDIIEAHGVTWLPETTGTETSTTGTSGTGTSTTASDASSSESSGFTGGASTVTSAATSTGIEDTADEASTGSPDLPSEPICGDGIVDGEETCDDANDIPHDGCNACAKDSIIFVTSELYQGFKIESLYQADQRCRGLAAMAGLPRAETYRAWLSSQTVAAKDRLLHSSGRYVLVNGLVVADDWAELTSGHLQRPIDVDEHSATQQTGVWTGTLADGSVAAGSTQCDDWTNPNALGGSGGSDVFDMWWTFVDHSSCGGEKAVYCVEQ